MSTTNEVETVASSATTEPVKRTIMRKGGTTSNFQFNPNRHKWVYGFWFKNKHMRLLAEKHKLDWQRAPIRLSFKIVDYVTRKSGVYYTMRAAGYKGKSALIATFVEDDDRRRLDRNEFSEEEMDRVRKAIGLPEGTKPRWYDVCGYLSDEGPEESEDEELPVQKFKC